MEKRPIFQLIKQRAEEPRRFIQVLLGPRQVGKTTLALQIAKALNLSCHYASADMANLQGLSWLQTQWQIARNLAKESKEALLIIDEVQKISHWSNQVKQLWDEDSRTKLPLKVFMLGSSPWLIQQGLTESLAGRFEIIPITHWQFNEMKTIFGWDLPTYIYFGGYPGAAPLVDLHDPQRWRHYINDSLIETTISRDILLMTQVNKPALLRRLFQLGCIYSSQILSYQKMLGQLHDAGNTTTLAHYLELLSGAGILTGMQKYSGKQVNSRSSSPKLMVLNTALMSAQNNKSFTEAKADTDYWGQLVESCIGAHLLNSIQGTDIKVYYWREGNAEVDFILTRGKKITAIEVKSGRKKADGYGLDVFNKKFKTQLLLTIGNHGISLLDFLEQPIYAWFK